MKALKIVATALGVTLAALVVLPLLVLAGLFVWLKLTEESDEEALELEQEGVSVEVVEPRTLKPLDVDAIVRSVAKTGRLVVVDSAPPLCSVASEVAATVAEEAFTYLRAPILRVTTPDVHVAFSAALDDAVWPSKDQIVAAVKRSLASE